MMLNRNFYYYFYPYSYVKGYLICFYLVLNMKIRFSRDMSLNNIQILSFLIDQH